MKQRNIAEQPRIEPEIIPPGEAPWAQSTHSGGQRVYVARVGPFGFAAFALVAAALAVVAVLLALGAFLILVPLAGLLLAAAVASSLLSGRWRNR
jgi:hypothetical protein